MSEGASRPSVLVVCDYYLPGSKGGGGTRTISNMVERMSESYDFRILCRDHDGPLDRTPYPGISYGTWDRSGSGLVRYLSGDELRPSAIGRAIAESGADVIYLNSVFSRLTWSCLMAARLGKVTKMPVVLAPCGELGSGALKQKSLKKLSYLLLAKLVGLYDGVLWKASNEQEAAEIRLSFPNAQSMIAPDVGRGRTPQGRHTETGKEPGRLRMVYISRITPKKNLKWLISLLEHASSGVTLDVFGDTDDPGYEAACEAAVVGSKVCFRGPLDHSQVESTLSEYDLLALPTLHENFGHVILEALSVGVPVLLSDRTPWTEKVRDVAGSALPIDEELWLSEIHRMEMMDADAFKAMKRGAIEVAHEFRSSGEDLSRTDAVLRAAIGGAY